MKRQWVFGGFVLSLSLLFGGCASLTTPKPDPTRFYVLEPLDKGAPAPDAIYCKGVHLGVGRVELPGYLDTQKIVKFKANNEVFISEFNRWAEPLPGACERVLAANIALLTGVESIETFPWVNPSSHDFEVHTEIQSFQANADNVVMLEVIWRITGARGKEVYHVEISTYAKPSDGSYPGIVSAMSAAWAECSESVARGLVQAARKKLEQMQREAMAEKEVEKDDAVIEAFEEQVDVSPKAAESSPSLKEASSGLD